MVFRCVGTKSFTPSPLEMDFLPKNSQIWPKIAIFGHILVFLAQKRQSLAQNMQYAYAILAFLAHLVPCPTKKQCEQGV